MVYVRRAGLSKQVDDALSDKWQTASLIAAQIDFRPESVTRTIELYTSRYGRPCSVSAAKTQMVSQNLRRLVLRGLLERRRLPLCKNEYRLKCAISSKHTASDPPSATTTG
jgi:DNA-binding HxlR family transcriptional regulator